MGEEGAEQGTGLTHVAAVVRPHHVEHEAGHLGGMRDGQDGDLPPELDCVRVTDGS